MATIGDLAHMARCTDDRRAAIIVALTREPAPFALDNACRAQVGSHDAAR